MDSSNAPPVHVLPAIEFAQKSDPGRDPEKQENEDACGLRATRHGHLGVVCDGMGGHAGGREAANLALETILSYFDAAPDAAPGGLVLKEAIALANHRVHTMRVAEVANGRPGSTVVAVLLHAGGTEVAHVGDSRVYLAHQGQIFQVTKDHSAVQQLVDAGLLSPIQAASHPHANQITRALGMTPVVDVDLRPQPLRHVAGDIFVLCSDGLSDLVAAPEILQIIGSAPPEQAAGQLVDLANARGGHDNITVLVIRARETASTSATHVSPTLAQTSIDAPSQRITLPEIPAAETVRLPSVRSTPRAAALSTPSTPSIRSSASLTLALGVLLALVGFCVAAVAIYLHVQARSGKKGILSWPPERPQDSGLQD